MDQMNTKAQLRIGELASEFGLNPKTLRYYEEIGLLPTPERAENGYRLYGEADRQRLRFIGQAKTVGLTLEEISQILALWRTGAPPCEHVVGLLDHKLRAVEEQLRTFADFRAELLTLREEARQTRHTEACVCGIIEQHQARQHRQESY